MGGGNKTMYTASRYGHETLQSSSRVMLGDGASITSLLSAPKTRTVQCDTTGEYVENCSSRVSITEGRYFLRQVPSLSGVLQSSGEYWYVLLVLPLHMR